MLHKNCMCLIISDTFDLSLCKVHHVRHVDNVQTTLPAFQNVVSRNLIYSISNLADFSDWGSDSGFSLSFILLLSQLQSWLVTITDTDCYSTEIISSAAIKYSNLTLTYLQILLTKNCLYWLTWFHNDKNKNKSIMQSIHTELYQVNDYQIYEFSPRTHIGYVGVFWQINKQIASLIPKDSSHYFH